MLGAAIALQFLKMQGLQAVKDPFVWSRSDDLHTVSICRYNRLRKTSVVCRVRLQPVELWVFEADVHATMDPSLAAMPVYCNYT